LLNLIEIYSIIYFDRRVKAENMLFTHLLNKGEVYADFKQERGFDYPNHWSGY